MVVQFFNLQQPTLIKIETNIEFNIFIRLCVRGSNLMHVKMADTSRAGAIMAVGQGAFGVTYFLEY